MSARAGLSVLVVDDDPAIRGALREILEHAGHTVKEADTGARAVAALESGRADVVLLDLAMPGMHGLEALERIRDLAPDTGVIVVTGEATLKHAIQAGQRGAFDFIEKPPDREHLLALVEQAARVTRLRRGPSPPPAADGLGIVGKSPAMAELMEQIRRIAPSQGRVLITGENGSGKELVAEAIHSLSKRASGAFVKLNCAAIPRELLESELFGYERGAFTGAVQAKKGRFELAHEGTLFLDEIGDLALDAQAKLLRALETGELERLGGTRTLTFDVRVLAATNRDLRERVEVGDFRQDLFYRLNVLPIHVPPLREHAGDIVPLAEHFLARFCEVEGRPSVLLDPEAAALLEDYPWPGNVRELRNLMERAAILVRGASVTAGDLSPWLSDSPGRPDATGLRGEIEKREAEAIRRALESAHWNVTQAAAGLGIDRTNLHRKMRKYGISRH
jgi:two-component system, NtrC family, nitrogen regulation response regulator NtrX